MANIVGDAHGIMAESFSYFDFRFDVKTQRNESGKIFWFINIEGCFQAREQVWSRILKDL